ncbi:MAG TPA: hypothetical protein DGG94_08245, partial [Micromonosporaceae bacterium]|nr:hypothetical protein [Micromonosporaceae bacterium]
DIDGHATALAADAHREVEAITDRVAQRPWDELGPEATERLLVLLTPLAQAAYQDIPNYNPIGLPSPILE